MIRKIRGLYTRITARIIPAREVSEKPINAKTIVHRRVEVTVERETVSILVPGKPVGDAGGTAGAASAQAPRPHLLPDKGGEWEA